MATKCLLFMSLLVMVLGSSHGLINLRYGPNYLQSTLVEDNSEEDDSSPHVFVDLPNILCDFAKPFGPSCNMTGSNAVLTVQDSPELSERAQYLEVEVHNANMVLLYPVCMPWVQLFGVRGLITKGSQDKSSTGKTCRTWLRSYNSHLGSLNNGLGDVSLVNSSVDVISLHNLRDFLALSSNISVIQHLDWQGYAGLLRDAHIGTIVSMQCNDNVSMTEVTIDTIDWNGFTFAGNTMRVNATTFGTVSAKGILIDKGELMLLNSVFEDLSTHGLTVRPGASVWMRNVTIERCEQPCIVVPYSESLVVQNLTIEGVSLEEMPGAVLYSEEDLAVHGNFSLKDSEECQIDSKNSEIIICDFENSNQNVFVTEDDANYTSVTINHSADFHIIGVCNLNLTLNNSSGLYTSNAAAVMDTCSSEGNSNYLTAINTTFHGLDTMHLDHLTLRQCSVRRLHTRAALQQVDIQDSTVDVLWLMVTGRVEWTDSRVSVATASLGQLEATRMQFTKVANLTIGGSGEINSTISDSVFDWCAIHGLTVTGSLVLQNVTFKETTSLSIFLAQGARLYLQDVTFLSHRTRHVISAANKNHVVWLSQNEDQSSSELVYTRLQRNGEEGAIVGKEPCKTAHGFGFMERFRFGPVSYMTCNYRNTEFGDNVVMRLPPRQNLLHVTIIAARNLSLEYACSHTIRIIDVEMVTMDELDIPCRYMLFGTNSHFDSITNQPTEVNLQNSSAMLIESSDFIRRLTLVNSTVDTISSLVETANIRQTNIKLIPFLDAINDANIDGSDISTIDTLVLQSNSSISNSVIRTVNADGIHVFDKLFIVNVIFNSLAKNAIVLEGGAQLLMINVTIDGGWIASLNFSQGSLTLRNVTLNGVPLLEDDVIRTEITHSVKTSTKPPTPTTSVAPPPSRVSTPPSTEAPTTLVPVDPDSRNTGVDAGGETQPWMRWARAGAGIFLGLLGVLAILSMAIVFRAHRRGQPLLPALRGFFGRTREDESILATEMESSVRDPSVTHYVRLPS